MGKGKKGKKDEGAAAAEETPDQAEWKNLRNEAVKLNKATKQEEQDFNEFQQQREKLNYFWIVEKKKLEDKRVELRNKARESQDLDEKHQVEIKIYKQRLKHLLYEQQNELTQKKTEAEVAVKMAQSDNTESQSDIIEDKRALNFTRKEIEFTHEECIRGLKKEHDQRVTHLRHEFERKAGEKTRAYEARMKRIRDSLDVRRKAEIKAIEDRKSTMIEQVMTGHHKAFSDIKNYYNDITHNNLDLIKSLKEEVKSLEAEERKDQIRLQEKMNENRKLSAPLKKMQESVVRLRSELEDYKVEKASMRRTKASLLLVEGKQDNSSWEYETLLQRLADAKKERDDLRDNLRASIYDVKQKSGFKGMLLEKKLSALQTVQEEKEAQLNEVLQSVNLEPTQLGQIKGHLDDVLQRKNLEARKYQSEIARLQTLQHQLYSFTKQKLGEYGMGLAELGFVPKVAQVPTIAL